MIKTNEQIKNEALTDLYLTGRYQNNYFGKKSKSKINPIKVYINMWLKRNNLYDLSNDISLYDLCEECYQNVFTELFKKPADKIVKILEESTNGSKLIATALRIVIFNCFSIKKNPASSGIIHNILNQSSYSTAHNVVISNSEAGRDEDNNIEDIVIYDDPNEVDEFEKKYKFSIEEIVERLTKEEFDFFYNQLKKQKVGKPNKETLEQREKFAIRIRQIKEELENGR